MTLRALVLAEMESHQTPEQLEAKATQLEEQAEKRATVPMPYTAQFLRDRAARLRAAAEALRCLPRSVDPEG